MRYFIDKSINHVTANLASKRDIMILLLLLLPAILFILFVP